MGSTIVWKYRTDSGISHGTFRPENPQSFFLEQTDTNLVEKVMNNMKDEAPARRGIFPKHLRCISETIYDPLLRTANLSFEQGVFSENKTEICGCFLIV